MTKTLTFDPTAKSAPRTAFAFAAPVPLQFLDAKGDERPEPSEQRVTVFARTADVVPHWYWGRIIHDMAGARHKDRVPFDWRHDSDVELGYADTITADDNGLTAEGPLQSIEEGDRASKVIRRGQLGHPYEASIYWDESDALLEYLDAGFVATVNGQTIEGPCVIAREWTLRAIAITPHGVDATTRTQFSDSDTSDSIPIRFATPKEPPVGKDQPTKDAVTDEPTVTEPTKPATTEPTKDERGELAKYMNRFGNERGAEYFRDSVPYHDACEKEIDTLRKANSDLAEQLKASKDALTKVNIGEESPVDTGTPTKDGQPQKWGDLFKRRG